VDLYAAGVATVRLGDGQRSPAPLVAKRRRYCNPTLHVIGLALLFLVPGLVISGFIEWGSSTSDKEWALFVSAVIIGIIGALLWSFTEISDDLGRRGVFSAVAWTWVACSILGALPYLLAGMFPWQHWDSALFESVSGFTTTGSTVLADIEVHGRGVLFWRQMTQWYGGMGMVVLAVTVLPFLGVGGLELISAEAPGDSSDRLLPRVSGTAKILWALYAGLTLAVALALFVVPGPSLYDAFAHALTTSSTGGFSPYNLSIGHFDSAAVELVIVAGLFLAGANFALHWRALRGDVGAYRRSPDFRAYLLMVIAGILVLAVLNTLDDLASFGVALGDALFNTVTIASSGGFGNITEESDLGDFTLWSPAAQLVILGLMVVGGSIGSTAGGLKVFRAQVTFAHFRRGMTKVIHPRSVLPLKLGDSPIPEEVVSRVLGFVTLFFLITLVGTLVVAATGADLITAGSAVVSAMSCVGPALGDAGPSSNYLVFTRPARLVIAAHMLIGRVEIFAILLMFAGSAQAVKNRLQVHR
jgi:trk system potassium uptake protein TrkH